MLSKKNLLLWKVDSPRSEETPEENALSPEALEEIIEIKMQWGYDREEAMRSMEESRREYISNQEYITDRSVPPELLALAAELGCDITVETFAAEGFTERFQEAIQQNLQPDIMAFEHYDIIRGFSSHLGEFKGLNTIDGFSESMIFVSDSLGLLPMCRKACHVIFKTSRHHEEAKLLALQEPECPSISQLPLDASVDRTELERIAQSIARSYMNGSLSELEEYISSDSIIPIRDLQALGQVKSIKICSLFGSEHLAIVSAVASFDGSIKIGNTEILMVFRKEGNSYRLLTISMDSLLNMNRYFSLDRVASAIANTSENSDRPQPALLLSPKNGKRPTPLGEIQRGNFKWQPSSSENIVAEVAEFNYNCDARLFVRFPQEKNKSLDYISEALLMYGGTWNWRIWSIAKNGSIAFSEVRSFKDKEIV